MRAPLLIALSATLGLLFAACDPKVVIIGGGIILGNLKPQNFYGKVVDQFDKPVGGVDVLGTLFWIRGIDSDEKIEHISTLTDEKGEFEFTGYHASKLGVVVSKEGYAMGQGKGFYVAPNPEDMTSSSGRAIFHMWKLIGPQPMNPGQINGAIPCDGTPTSFNLDGRRVAGGDLVVTLKRNPVNIDRGKPFDWTLQMNLVKGGFVEISDLYPYTAPMEGYHPITISMAAKDKPWVPNLGPDSRRSYYFKNGDVYGRISIQLEADFQPPPTFFGADIITNPSGSRNLEPTLTWPKPLPTPRPLEADRP
jgi:hypothetical protein